MPINFMPPGPVAPGLAAAGGAAEAQMRDFPTLASFYSHMASLRAGAEAQAGAANAQRMQQDRQFAWNAGEQQQEFAAGLSQQQSATSEHAAATEASLQNALMQQQQHAALDVWASGQKLSQADRMQEQERQNGLARLRKAKDDGQIDAGTYYDGVASLMTGINQFGARQKREEMEAQTAHLNQLVETGKSQAAAQAASAQLLAQSLAGQVKFVPDKAKLQGLREELMDAGEGPVALGFNPTAQQEFESRVASLAEERGHGNYYVPGAKGELHPDPFDLERKKASSRGSGGRGAEFTAANPRDLNAESKQIGDQVREWVKQETLAGRSPSSDDIRKKAEEITATHNQVMSQLRAAQPEHPAAVAKRQVEEKQRDEVTQLKNGMEELSKRTLPPHIGLQATQILVEAKRLVEKYPPDQRPPKIEQQLLRLRSQYHQLVPPVIESAPLSRSGAIREAAGPRPPRSMEEMMDTLGQNNPRFK